MPQFTTYRCPTCHGRWRAPARHFMLATADYRRCAEGLPHIHPFRKDAPPTCSR